MERITRRRALIILIVFFAIMLSYAFTLYDMQIIQTGGAMDNRSTFTTYTRVKAARGDILDRNGNPLVSNRASFDLVINHYVVLSANGTNQNLYNLVKRCQEEGIAYNESFPVTKERPFTYTLDRQSSTQQGYFQTFLNYVGGIDSDITAPLLIQRLRERYGFPAEWTDEEARAVIGLRYEMSLRNCVGSLSNYVFIHDVSEEGLSAIMELAMPGMYVEASSVREYSSVYAAHILGYVGLMSPEQWSYYQNLGYSMDAEVGQAGLEAAFEEYLHGTDGLREDTVTVDGTIISSRYITYPKAGAHVEVTIDLNLQRVAEEEMARVAESISASGGDIEGMALVAMDTRTGQVLACASYPTYDPARFFADYNTLITDPLRPTYNRALLSTYPPGSTYKMSMVIAGIDGGVVGTHEVIQDKGVYTKYASSNFTPTCLAYSSWGGVHYHTDAAEALKVSCNYYFYELGDRFYNLGEDRRLVAMDSTAKALGLGEKTGVELFEYSGYRANEQTKEELYAGYDRNWNPADQISAAIGQSDNRFTPIQLCSYAATLANRGTRFKATFLNRIVSTDYRELIQQNSTSVLSRLEISDSAYWAYTEGMRRVAHESGGTAYSTFAGYPITVAAKTGTAQNGILGATDNGAFVCYAPFDEPQIAIAIYGERSGGGGKLAPIAKAMLDVYFDVDEVGDTTTYENKVG